MMYEQVEKEAIDESQIIPAFVDQSEKWNKELTYAMRLGNEFKGKTNISFETKSGVKTVMTTVWSVVGQFLQLKGGKMIPLNSIVDVHY